MDSELNMVTSNSNELVDTTRKELQSAELAHQIALNTEQSVRELRLVRYDHDKALSHLEVITYVAVCLSACLTNAAFHSKLCSHW